MALIKEYFALTEKYTAEYGPNTVVLLQVGAFFEVYGQIITPADGAGGAGVTCTGSRIDDFCSICELAKANKTAGVLMAGFRDYTLEKYLQKIYHEGLYPIEIYNAWIDLGLFRIGFPEEYGGIGGDLKDLLLISQELAHWSYDIYSAYSVPLYTALTLLKIGTEEQKKKLLPALMDGKIRLSTSISEPSAGSDVSAIKTIAKPVDGGWIINGQKLWNTAAGVADNVLQVLVRTDPDTPPRSGMSMFLIPNNTPGVECRKLEMLGRRGTGTYEVFFTDVFVPAENMVG
jgi:alkylation response protein AidB-like acyl-CoA dehydrogenase